MSKALEEFEKSLNQYFSELEDEEQDTYVETSIGILQGHAIGKVINEHKRMEVAINLAIQQLEGSDSIPFALDALKEFET